MCLRADRDNCRSRLLWRTLAVVENKKMTIRCSRLARPLFSYFFVLFFFFFFFFLERYVVTAERNSSSTFLERCRLDCSLQRDFATCGKYKAARWLNDIVKEKEFSYGPFRLIRISSMQQGALLPKLPRSRAFKSNIIDTLDFLRENVNDLLTKRAIVYTIENPTNARSFIDGPMLMDEDELQDIQSKKESQGDWRIFKKKKNLILPVLILLNLFKLKLLLLPIFLGVHFIKKLLVLGSLIAPSILAHLKVCKVQPHQTYPYHTWATAAEAPVDYPTGYGSEDGAWAHRNDIQGHLGYPPVYHGYRNPYG